jgi:hypothetical protein
MLIWSCPAGLNVVFVLCKTIPASIGAARNKSIWSVLLEKEKIYKKYAFSAIL